MKYTGIKEVALCDVAAAVRGFEVEQLAQDATWQPLSPSTLAYFTDYSVDEADVTRAINSTMQEKEERYTVVCAYVPNAVLMQ